MFLDNYRTDKKYIFNLSVDLLDLDVNSTTIWDAVRPSCIPCPKHGHCTKGRLLGCDDFFVRIPSMLSFGGWIPVGEKCVPDTVKQRRAFRVENQIKNMLAVKKGQYICGDIKAEKGQSEDEVASMKVEDVWTELLARKPVSSMDMRVLRTSDACLICLFYISLTLSFTDLSSRTLSASSSWKNTGVWLWLPS